MSLSLMTPTYRHLLRFSQCLGVSPDEAPAPPQEVRPSQPSYKELPPLVYYRRIRGWSQRDVAERITELCNTDTTRTRSQQVVFLNTDTVSKWERSRNKPDSFYSKYLCQLYGVTADQLGIL